MVSYYSMMKQARLLIKELYQAKQTDITIVNVIEEKFGIGRKKTLEIINNIRELEKEVEMRTNGRKK